MNYPLAPYYRSYRLWDLDSEQERRFRRLWLSLLVAGAVLAAIVSLVPVPERPPLAQQTIPPRLARVVIERESPPPPPPPPVVEQELPRPEQPKPEVAPQSEQRREQARRRAEAQLASVRDELASIRQAIADPLPRESGNLTGAVGAESRAERSLITSRAGTGSAGVVSTGASRGFGSGAGNLSEHATAAVESTVASTAAAGATVSRGGSGKPARSAEEIEQEFDRNRGAIYALYVRALREQADLQGKMVLEFTIAPEGNVTACRVVSSELNHPELENRICTRVRGFRFPARDVAAVTTTKPIDFFPQG